MDIGKLIPVAFKLLKNTDKIRALVQESQATVDELKKVWPEAAPLIKDIIQRSMRLYEIMQPTLLEAKEAWPKIEPMVHDLQNQLWPELVAQWAKEKQESTLPTFSVRWLQENLNNLGASPRVVVDGSMGPQTHAAIRAYQKKKGIAEDGWAGPETLTSMLKDLG